MLLRGFASAVLAVSFCLVPSRPVLAQQASASSTPVDLDKVDARAFASLFRQFNSYEARAKAATGPEKPEARLGTVIPRMFQLDETKVSSLRRIAVLWQKDSKVIHDQVRATINQHDQNYQSSLQHNGPDKSFFLSLQASQQALDKITLQYRDALRTDLPEGDYQKLAAQVRKVFAGNLASGSQPETGSP